MEIKNDVCLKLKNLVVSYGDKTVLNGIDFELKRGSVVALLGASGVGKTTLLNVIAKKITNFTGEIYCGYDKVSYVFQEDRLVPNLTVEQNIRLISKDADVSGLLESLNLVGSENLYPKQLSKGMAKRVSLARALSYKGDVMLLDEPFSNLDVAVKIRSEELLKSVVKKEGLTAILVTHDVDEAFSVANEIYVLTETGMIKVSENRSDAEREIKSIFLNGSNV